MICTEYDQWLKDQDKTVWMVELEWVTHGGREPVLHTAYQDDGRPNTEHPAWIRLKKFMSQLTGVGYWRIKRLGLGFRDHLEWLPIDKSEGIYFSKGAIADMLSPHTSNCYVLGWIKDGVLTKVWYRIPEVIEYQREEVRDFDPESPAIIWCK